MKKRQEIYDLYWYFACERQNIFIKKLNNESAPWTKDPILQEYKFCNSYRVNDRVSQYLLKNVIYNDKKYSDEDMLFRILLFKLFNKESTWELLLNNFEDIALKTFNITEYSKVLENAISNNIKIYNDAYISCANKAFCYDRKHDNHLALLNKMFNEDKIADRIVKCKTMEEAFNIIKSYPLIGNFMAYQLVTDINYSTGPKKSSKDNTNFVNFINDIINQKLITKYDDFYNDPINKNFYTIGVYYSIQSPTDLGRYASRDYVIEEKNIEKVLDLVAKYNLYKFKS